MKHIVHASLMKHHLVESVLIPDILSESVSKALLMTGGSEASQTANFVEMMDKFFDSLNVTSFERGKRQR